MFGQHAVPGNNQGISRPFVVGLILLLLFLSLQTTDWSPQTARRSDTKPVLSAAQLREGVKEKLLLELSVVNDKLEAENKRLKQYILDVRRTLRNCGCEYNATTQFVFPELHEVSDDHYRENIGNGTQGNNLKQPDPLPAHSRNR